MGIFQSSSSRSDVSLSTDKLTKGRTVAGLPLVPKNSPGDIERLIRQASLCRTCQTNFGNPQRWNDSVSELDYVTHIMIHSTPFWLQSKKAVAFMPEFNEVSKLLKEGLLIIPQPIYCLSCFDKMQCVTFPIYICQSGHQGMPQQLHYHSWTVSSRSQVDKAPRFTRDRASTQTQCSPIKVP